MSEVDRLAFLRRLPHALDNLHQLREAAAASSLAVFLDFDGTLAPIVDDPDDARLPQPTKVVIRELAERLPLAVVSGRDRRDVEGRVGLEHVFYAGNHGFDIIGPGCDKTLPEAEQARDAVDHAAAELEERLGALAGVVIERKRYSVAVHHRMVDAASTRQQVHDAVDAVADATGLRRRTGKKVLELEPDVDWNKGRALRWIMQALSEGPETRFALYVGDDDTDEDAFAVLRADGLGVRVGEAETSSLADYHVEDPDQVRQLLSELKLISFD